MAKQKLNPKKTNTARGLLAKAGFVSLLLGVVTLALFWPVRHFGYITLDDPDYVTANPHVQSGFTWEGVGWAFRIGYAHNWHPVTWFSHFLDADLFGAGAGGPHLLNLLLHTANSILLFLLLREATGAHWRSALVGALFALHPLHVESVAWISERKDVLSTLFWLLTMWTYGKAAGSGQASDSDAAQILKSRWYWLSLAFFAVGLMSKPMLVTLPVVLLLWDYWPLERVERKPKEASQRGRVEWVKAIGGLLFEKIPFLALSAASCVITIIAQKKAIQSFIYFPLSARIENAFVSYVRYLGKMFWPTGLALPYPPHPNHWPPGLTAFALMLFVVMGVAAIRFGGKAPFLTTGWFWFVTTLIPVIGLVQVGIQSLADRYAYVPLIGIFIVLSWGGEALMARLGLPRVVLGAAALICLGAFGARTRDQLGYWQDSERLFRHSLAVSQNDGLAHYTLGFYLFEKGRLEEAIEHYRQALLINPVSPELLSDLGAALDGLGKSDEAIEQLTQALRLAPDEPNAHYRLGNALTKVGRNSDAIESFRRAVRHKPDFIEAHNNLAVALYKGGMAEEAIKEFREVVHLKPKEASAYYNLGNALAAQGRWTEAAGEFEEALRLKSDSPETHFRLGEALANLGRKREAVAQLNQALRLRPDYAPARQLLKELGND